MLFIKIIVWQFILLLIIPKRTVLNVKIKYVKVLNKFWVFFSLSIYKIITLNTFKCNHFYIQKTFSFFFSFQQTKKTAAAIYISSLSSCPTLFLFLSPFPFFHSLNTESQSHFFSLFKRNKKCESCRLSSFPFKHSFSAPFFLRFNYPKFEVNIGFWAHGETRVAWKILINFGTSCFLSRT